MTATSVKTKDWTMLNSISKFSRARRTIFGKYPRLYDAMDLCRVQMTRKVQTAGIAPRANGEYDFLWNPIFVDSLSDLQTEGLIIHELLHICFEHVTTRLPKFDFDVFDSKNKQRKKADTIEKLKLWNVATDCAINQFIRDQLLDPLGFNMKPCLPENYEMPLFLNAEAYFRLLAEQKDNQTKSGIVSGDGRTDDLDDHAGWQQQPPEEKEEKKENQEKLADIQEKKENQEKLADIQKDLGIDSKDYFSPGAGTSSIASVNITCAKGLKPTPGWMRKTKHEAVHGFDVVIKATRKVANRRWGNIFPGKKRIDMGNRVLIAIDVSSSISVDKFKIFTEHVNKFTKFSEFDVVWFNYSLVDEQGNKLFTSGVDQDPRKAIRRFRMHQQVFIGGGTSFEPVMQLWNKVSDIYNGLFIFTDGDAKYSTKPKHPKAVNWIVYNQEDLKNIKDGTIWMMNEKNTQRSMPKQK